MRYPAQEPRLSAHSLCCASHHRTILGAKKHSLGLRHLCYPACSRLPRSACARQFNCGSSALLRGGSGPSFLFFQLQFGNPEFSLEST